MADTARIAVVGAGPAGLACADLLAAHGLPATVFERSHGIGGRVATRRRDGWQADHGAQFLWLDPGDDLLIRARACGAVAPWPAAALNTGQVPWVGVPRMKDVLQPLLEGLDIRHGAEVRRLSRSTDGWQVETAQGTHAFDAVVLAAPAPQILRCLDPREAELCAALSPIRFAPCHALMVAFETAAPWPDVVRDPPAPFTLIQRDSAKPGRAAGPDCHVAHTTAAWSRGQLDTDAEAVSAALLSALGAAIGPLPPVRHVAAHRWGLSTVTRTLGAPFAESGDGRVLAGGDWALGPTVADALASGRAMARRVIARFA